MASAVNSKWLNCFRITVREVAYVRCHIGECNGKQIA